MEQLIQSITAYTTALEQKISALEVRVAQLEQQIEEANETIGRLGERLEAKGERLEEPEIEIELVMDDDEEVSVEQETLEIIEDTTEPEPVAEPIAEPVIEPMVEPAPIVELEPQVEPALQVEPAPVVVEPVVEKPVVEKPAPRPMPQQTSLFGTAVEDIRQAISLGDRFLFQRELFAGNGELMQKTLDEINALGSLSEAITYIQDNFEWDKESTAVQLFENVLKRRFA